MTEKTEALRLAAALDAYWGAENGHDRERQAAAELRRLQALLEAEQALHQRVTYPELQRLRAQRDALLEALKDIAGTEPVDAALDPQRAVRIARAAIKAVEEENHAKDL